MLRRAFFAQLPGELARARRDGRALCVLYLDVDNFKQVNDRYGHAAGDQALQAVARELQGCLRAGDLTARLGGDEFAAVLWAADRDAVVAVAQRVIERIAALDDVYPGTELGASVGAVHYAHPPAEADALLRAADQAMYEAKTSGKRTVVFRTGDGPRPGPVTRPDAARAR